MGLDKTAQRVYVHGSQSPTGAIPKASDQQTPMGLARKRSTCRRLAVSGTAKIASRDTTLGDRASVTPLASVPIPDIDDATPDRTLLSGDEHLASFHYCALIWKAIGFRPTSVLTVTVVCRWERHRKLLWD